LLLLLAHPNEQAHSIQEVAELEVRLRGINAAVHGGTILVLVLLLGAHVLLVRLTDRIRLGATLAAIALGAGCVLMMLSLVLDGFVTPALAVQFLAAKSAPAQQAIQSQMQFCGTCIRALMPLALASFAVSAVLWCGPLMRLNRRGRFVGAIGAAVGLGICALIVCAPPQMFAYVLVGGLLLVALWQFALTAVVLGGAQRDG
jgi:hypothetical protein